MYTLGQDAVSRVSFDDISAIKYRIFGGTVGGGSSCLRVWKSHDIEVYHDLSQFSKKNYL